ncbi:MAG: hypothetical protein PHW24_01500 [Candidatus Moranbacteria bacterium]|nr:hypothetical protein [Candidatus Moranbacteria bacterium]
MKKVCQFFVIAGLFSSIFLMTKPCIGSDFSDVENSVRFRLKNDAVAVYLRLDHELVSDDVADDLENLLINQEDEELLLAIVEVAPEHQCNDDPTLKIIFADKYKHCRM